LKFIDMRFELEEGDGAEEEAHDFDAHGGFGGKDGHSVDSCNAKSNGEDAEEGRDG
jgi:hypothetical protein